MTLLLHLSLKREANSLQYLYFDQKVKEFRNLSSIAKFIKVFSNIQNFTITKLTNFTNLTIVNFKASLKHANDYLFYLFLDEVDSYNRELKFQLIEMLFSLAIRK